MKTQLTVLIASLGFATSVLAAPQTFDFKDPKGINKAGFKLDAPLESINGSASRLTRTDTFDPENPTPAKATVRSAADTRTLLSPIQHRLRLSGRQHDR